MIYSLSHAKHHQNRQAVRKRDDFILDPQGSEVINKLNATHPCPENDLDERGTCPIGLTGQSSNADPS
jgi:hypothetical protein